MVRRRLALVLVGVLAVPGCAQIPHSGAIVEGGRVDAPADSRGLEPVAVGPTNNASGPDIVNGLVSAMVSSDDEFAVARSFLSPELAQSWRPRQSTIVFQGTPEVSLGRDAGGRVAGRVTVRQIATVGADGRYQRMLPRRRDIPVAVGKNGAGQWRVTSFPGLTAIDDGDFSFAYRPHEVFYVSQDGNSLVPVERYFPNGSGLSTRLAAAVLAGPPPELRSAYSDPAPAGVALASPATVTTSGSSAEVALTDQARSASPDQRAALQSQLLATLRGVLPVTDVELSVAGGVLDDTGGRTLDPLGEPAVSPVIVRGGRLGRFDGSRDTPVPAVGDLSRLDPTAVAENGDGSRFALTGALGSRLYLFTPSGAPGRPVLTGSRLTKPSFDAAGWVYTTPATSPGYVWAADADGQLRQVDAPWLRGRLVRSFCLSQDGGLAAVVSSTRTSGPGRLDVVAVQRRNGVPIALKAAPDEDRSLPGEDVRTAAWRSPTDLTVGTDKGISFLPVDGPAVPTVDSPRPQQLASDSSSGVGDLAVTDRSRLYQFSGGSWYAVSGMDGVRSVAFPG